VSLAALPLGRPLRPDLPRRRTSGSRVTVEVLVTVALCVLVALFFLPTKMDPLVAAAVVPAGVAVALFLRDPIWCVLGVVATTFFGTYHHGIALGPFDVRASDVPLVFLMGWVVHLRISHGRSPRSELGQRQVGLLLGVFGVSLLTAHNSVGGELSDLLVSLARLVATCSLIWLVPYAVRSPKQRTFVLKAMVLLGFAELCRAVFVYVRLGKFPGRIYGANGPNAEGLIAAVVVIAVVNLALFRPRTRVVMAVVALAVLVQTRSISSVVALMVVLGFYGLRVATARHPRTEALLRPARLLALLFGAVLVISTLRPGDLPNQSQFVNSSTASRVTLAYAGWVIFTEHPLLGVGWQRSSATDVIGSESVVDAVKARFPDVREDLLPSGDSVTVHNAYVQILAENGVVGVLALLAVILGVRKGIRGLSTRGRPDAAVIRTLVALLAVVLIWWNDNPIFGAQPESILFALLLGLLAASPHVPEPVEAGRRRPEHLEEPAASVGA
jgi:O-antigen ligase